MRSFAAALVLTAALAGCRESPTPPNIPPVNVQKDGLHGSEAADTKAPAGEVTIEPSGPRMGTPTEKPDDVVEAGKADAAKVEACVDAFLAEKDLNEYGDPKGTMYAGGTPLFDESTGRSMDRIDYVLLKHPELRERCLK